MPCKEELDCNGIYEHFLDRCTRTDVSLKNAIPYRARDDMSQEISIKYVRTEGEGEGTQKCT